MRTLAGQPGREREVPAREVHPGAWRVYSFPLHLHQYEPEDRLHPAVAGKRFLRKAAANVQESADQQKERYRMEARGGRICKSVNPVKGIRPAAENNKGKKKSEEET